MKIWLWKRGLGIEDLPLLQAQLLENATVVPACIAGNFAAVCACAALLSYHNIFSPLVVFAGAAVFLCIASLRLSIPAMTRKCANDDPRLVSLFGLLALIGTALGGLWGLFSYVVLSSGIHLVEVVGGIIAATMMSAGTITFRTLRAVALTYVILCGVGTCLGLISIGSFEGYIGAALTACFTLVLCANVIATSKRFDRGIMRERRLNDAADTIKLLLDDFTEQGLGWIVEVDRNGQIQNPCERLIEFSGRTNVELSSLRFEALIDTGPELSRVRKRFREGKVIRQHILPVSVKGQKKWISLSARPKPQKDSGYRGVMTDVTSQRHAEEQVSFLAHYDALTKLPNRLLFRNNLTQAILRHGGHAAVMYLDLDNFKTINDTLGHPLGDKVLVEVARRIEATIGHHDLACRFGGDAFVILVTGSRAAKVEHLAKRLIEVLSVPITADQQEIDSSCSIGIAIGPDDGENSDCLIRRADLALDHAKLEGRGSAIRFQLAMEEAAHSRRSIESDMGNALRNGEFEVQYQALVDAQNCSISGYEALVRWHHPERGLIMPNSFIPIAEESGFIIPLGDWVIRQAIAEAANWPDHIIVSINLSPVQLRNPSLIGTLIQALSHNGVSPNRVCLEITESVLMQDSKANLEALHRLRDLGMMIALDDFGTGFSSLNYLRIFPFSKIKIDRCFISEIEESPDCQAIVRAVITLANSLGMTTIAEGIERESQANLLRVEGCSLLQGFLYSKAVSANAVLDTYSSSPCLHAALGPERRAAMQA